MERVWVGGRATKRLKRLYDNYQLDMKELGVFDSTPSSSFCQDSVEGEVKYKGDYVIAPGCQLEVVPVKAGEIMGIRGQSGGVGKPTKPGTYVVTSLSEIGGEKIVRGCKSGGGWVKRFKGEVWVNVKGRRRMYVL